MKKTLKKYFIPHAENNYHPHILHAKRAVFYSVVAVVCKIIVVAFVLLLPAEVYVAPDVLAQEAKEIARLTNKSRAENRLPALKDSLLLNNSANAKAVDMSNAGYFSHQTNNGRNLAYWLNLAGYKYRAAGENLAVGFADAASVVEAWKKSPTHFANIVDAEYVDSGVALEGGVYNGEPVIFVVEHFGEPAASAPARAVSRKARVNSPSITNASTTASSTAIASSTLPASSTPVVMLSFSNKSSFGIYRSAKSILGERINVFSASRYIYAALIAFFTLALLINILVEIRTQRLPVIAQTLVFILLAVGLYKI